MFVTKKTNRREEKRQNEGPSVCGIAAFGMDTRYCRGCHLALQNGWQLMLSGTPSGLLTVRAMRAVLLSCIGCLCLCEGGPWRWQAAV